MKYLWVVIGLAASWAYGRSVSYDPFELEFFPSTCEGEASYLVHRNVKILLINPQLDEVMKEQLEQAKRVNSKVDIHFSAGENSAGNGIDFLRIFRIVNEEPENQRFMFNYKDIKYNKKIFFGSDIVAYRIGQRWEEIIIASRDVMEGLMAQIDFAKKYKKWVSVNIKLLENRERQQFLKPMTAIAIVPD